MGSGDSGNRPEAGMMSNVVAKRTGIAALIRGPKDFWTGVIYLLFGGIAFWIAQDYGFGTASRMGPGYFPSVLSALLVLIGLISLVRSFIVRASRWANSRSRRGPYHSLDSPVRLFHKSRGSCHCDARARTRQRGGERKVSLRMEGSTGIDCSDRLLRAGLCHRPRRANATHWHLVRRVGGGNGYH